MGQTQGSKKLVVTRFRAEGKGGVAQMVSFRGDGWEPYPAVAVTMASCTTCLKFVETDDRRH